MISKLGCLPVCVICAASPSVCVTFCVSHCVCYILCVTLCFICLSILSNMMFYLCFHKCEMQSGSTMTRTVWLMAVPLAKNFSISKIGKGSKVQRNTTNQKKYSFSAFRTIEYIVLQQKMVFSLPFLIYRSAIRALGAIINVSHRI